MRQQRGVGRHDHDDRAEVAVFALFRERGVGRLLRDLAADGYAGNQQFAATAEVGLNQHAHRVFAAFVHDHARGRADATLELVADHAGAAADVALRNRARTSAIERGECVLWLNVKAVDVVEPPVPGLRDDWQRPPVFRVEFEALQRPADHGITHDADAVRIGDHDRSVQQAGFLDPGGAGHFAVAILREPAGEDGVGRITLASRQHRGDARSHHRFLAARRSGDDRAVAHLDTRHTARRGPAPAARQPLHSD